MTRSARSSYPVVQLCDTSFTYGVQSDIGSDTSKADKEEIQGEVQEEVQGKVSGISLQVKPGECLILCGGSGDGKSTVLRMIEGLAGTFFPGIREGGVKVCGYDVLNWPVAIALNVLVR